MPHTPQFSNNMTKWRTVKKIDVLPSSFKEDQKQYNTSKHATAEHHSSAKLTVLVATIF